MTRRHRAGGAEPGPPTGERAGGEGGTSPSGGLAGRSTALGTVVLRLALLIHPRWFRERYGPEMVSAFGAAVLERRRQGRWSALTYALRAAADVARSGWRERRGAARSHPGSSPGTPGHEAPRDTRGGGMGMGEWWSDVRVATRGLRRTPWFTFATVAVLALGIGANAAIFSIIETTVLRPPYPEPDRLVVVQDQFPTSDGPASLPDFLEWRQANHSFDALVAEFSARATWAAPRQPERIRITYFSDGYMPVFGVTPRLGRLPRSDEHVKGADHVCLVGDAFWRKHLGGDPGIVGHSVDVDGTSYTIVGVLPPGAPNFFHQATDVWLPLEPRPPYDAHGTNFLNVIGRMRPGISQVEAVQDIAGIQRDIDARFPANRHEVRGTSLASFTLGPGQRILMLLFGAAGLLLLIACANVANLLLVRGMSRTHELALRGVLGASRWRLVRQLLTEGVVLAAVAGAGALMVAGTTVKLVGRLWPANVWRPRTFVFDGRVFGFALLVALGTALLSALVPALRVSRPAASALREGARQVTSGPRHRGLRSALVVGETALATLLLVGSVLMVRSLWMMLHSDLGFDPDELLTMRIARPSSTTEESRRQFFAELVERAAALPGVGSSAATAYVPLGAGGQNGDFEVEGHEKKPGEQLFADENFVTPGYFATMRIRLREGRAFTDADRPGAPRVVIVNETMARKLWPGRNPVGKRIGVLLGPDQWEEVVGVVEDVRAGAIDAAPTLQVYLPFRQFTPDEMTVVARYHGDARPIVQALRAQVHALDPAQPVGDVQIMDALLSRAASSPRAGTYLLSLFALLAVALAAVGVYALMAYAVSSRRPELGLRMALGARAGDIRRLVVGDGVRLSFIGLGLGLAAALLGTRVLRSLLFGVTATDPSSYAAAALLLTGVALLASWLPAHRAARVDPMEALRDE